MTPKRDQTRPTQARLRQALFNSLQQIIPGSQILDLFSGSGTLGFEALSRGANQVVFVENHESVVSLIQKNAIYLKVVDQVIIFPWKVNYAWRKLLSLGPYDVVLADPPYAQGPYSPGWALKLLLEAPWQGLLKPSGFFCLEWSSQKSRILELPQELPCLIKVREKNYGETVLTTYQRKTDER